MTAGNWGGSAAGGGLEFQAAVSAVCMVHMIRGVPLGWCESVNDTPLSISAESGGAGDDIALQLADDNVLEIQAKRRLRADLELWESLIALLRRANESSAFRGVLAVGPSTSVAIRDQLARDIIRIGQGRDDDLSSLAFSLIEKLTEARISLSSCAQVRIQTVHVLEQDGASAQAALAHLEHISTQPKPAWDRLVAEGMRLIRLRGRCNAISLARIIPGLGLSQSQPIAPAVVAAKLLEWTLSTTATFTIPAVGFTFSLDNDWIKLNSYRHNDSNIGLNSLEEALTQYHGGRPKNTAPRQDRDEFDAETLGYFVRQCVIVAGPGMGKTQLLRRIARLLARKNEPALLVRLRPLAERMRSGETFIEAALHLGIDASSLRFEEVRALGMQNLTLLLDGLDESGSEQEDIARAALALAASLPQCRIIFTTRPVGYETAWLSKWQHYELIPIEASDAKRAVERLVIAANINNNPEISQVTAAAISHLDYRRNYRFQAKSPLLIALLASLALNGVLAAKTREGLYGQLFKLIEKLAATKRYSTQLTPAILNAVLRQFGWELATHPYADREDSLSACAKMLAVELDERLLKARSICEEALAFWEASGIIERIRFRNSEALTFVHKTFGEYAAAQYLLEREATYRLNLLSTIEPKQQWNEILIFASTLGIGLDLVNLALDGTPEGTNRIIRLLQWAKSSKDILPAQVAKMVLQQAWAVVEGPHSGKAFKAGIDLVAASEKLPGAVDSAATNRFHFQWWTALVGWACFVRCSPRLLDFQALITFMESYAERADTRKISGGFYLYNPDRDLWEDLLISAAREITRRKIGIEEQRFIDRMTTSLSSYSVGFFREFSKILGESGVEFSHPKSELLASKYVAADFITHSEKSMLALLEAICGDYASPHEFVEPPFLHLSAFFYGTGFMNMDLSAAMLAGSDAKVEEVRKIVTWVARQGAYDYNQLIAEVQNKVEQLKMGDKFSSFDGILSVDAPIRWNSSPALNEKILLTHSLVSSSEWIVYIAANLAENHLTAVDAEELVLRVFAESEGLGMAAAGHLAIELLGKDKARALIVRRLQQPLNSGCQHLFQYLAAAWNHEIDPQIDTLLRPALFLGPRTAKAALVLVSNCSQPYRNSLAPLLMEAYHYWLEHEGPYPKEGGLIPESPRGDILKIQIEYGMTSLGDLFLAAQDSRSEVSSPAIEALLTTFPTSETARNILIQRIWAGEALDKVLKASLLNHTPFSSTDIQSILQLLATPHAKDRYAAASILQSYYLSPNEIQMWSGKLLEDPYQHIRDKAYECIAELECNPKKTFNY